MKPHNSAYSKMYLVTPTVYEKLLVCIDEGDKRVTETLNKPESEAEKRPSEVALEQVSSSDINPASEIVYNVNGKLMSNINPDLEMTLEEKYHILSGTRPASQALKDAIYKDYPLDDFEKYKISNGDWYAPDWVKQKIIMEADTEHYETEAEVGPSSRTYGPPVTSRFIPPTFVQNPFYQGDQPPLVDVSQSVEEQQGEIFGPPAPSSTPLRPVIIAPRVYQPTGDLSQVSSANQRRTMGIGSPCVITRGGTICRPPSSIPKTSGGVQPSRTKKQCAICLKWYDRQWGLDRHMRTIHREVITKGIGAENVPLSHVRRVENVPVAQVHRVLTARQRFAPVVTRSSARDWEDMPLAGMRSELKSKRTANAAARQARQFERWGGDDDELMPTKGQKRGSTEPATPSMDPKVSKQPLKGTSTATNDDPILDEANPDVWADFETY